MQGDKFIVAQDKVELLRCLDIDQQHQDVSEQVGELVLVWSLFPAVSKKGLEMVVAELVWTSALELGSLP